MCQVSNTIRTHLGCPLQGALVSAKTPTWRDKAAKIGAIAQQSPTNRARERGHNAVANLGAKKVKQANALVRSVNGELVALMERKQELARAAESMKKRRTAAIKSLLSRSLQGASPLLKPMMLEQQEIRLRIVDPRNMDQLDELREADQTLVRLINDLRIEQIAKEKASSEYGLAKQKETEKELRALEVVEAELNDRLQKVKEEERIVKAKYGDVSEKKGVAKKRLQSMPFSALEAKDDPEKLWKNANFLWKKKRAFEASEKAYERAKSLISDRRSMLRSRDRNSKQVVVGRDEHATLHSKILDDYSCFLRDVRKDYTKAYSIWKTAVDMDPNNGNALGNIASLLHTKLKQPEMAERHYRRAIIADPSHVRNLANFGMFLQKQGHDPDGAEQCFCRALEQEPNNAGILSNYANFLKKIRGDYDKAEHMYKRAMEANPQHAGAIGNYANFLRRNRKSFVEAARLFRKAMEIAPNHTNNAINYAGLLKYMGKYDDAEEVRYLPLRS